MIITSTKNPLVQETKKLWERRERDKTKTFLIEGYRELLRASESKVEITTLLIAPELFLGSNEEALIQKLSRRGAKVVTLHPKVFSTLSYRDRPDGLLAIATQWEVPLENFPLSPLPFLIVAESIEKPGNLGTILRSADGAGADGVILADKCTDLFNPNVVRASVGTLFSLPVIEARTEELLPWLSQNGIAIVAATPHATLEFTEANFTQPLAIIVGSEQYGLQNTWLQSANIQVKIPMKGKADSLNVATATTLLLYEVLRQRTKK